MEPVELSDHPSVRPSTRPFGQDEHVHLLGLIPEQLTAAGTLTRVVRLTVPFRSGVISRTAFNWYHQRNVVNNEVIRC